MFNIIPTVGGLLNLRPFVVNHEKVWVPELGLYLKLKAETRESLLQDTEYEKTKRPVTVETWQKPETIAEILHFY